MTPAAGPDSSIWTGVCAARWADMMPPFDCMMRTGASERAVLTLSTRESVYDLTMGPREALTTVVLVRSYSRISGSTSTDRETKTPGSVRRSSSPMARSWSG